MRRVIDLHANGKLLISGEYLVLVGATALAFPVRFGQNLHADETEEQTLMWESFTPDGRWFTGKFDMGTFHVISTDEMKTAVNLKKLLKSARRLNPDFLAGQSGFRVCVRSDYPLEWGLGSSATLISLVARWANADAYELFRLNSTGSGYDIACAERLGLLYYRLLNGLPEIIPVKAGKALRKHTFFVYLGNKQDSTKEVGRFIAEKKYSEQDVEQVSRLSSFICQAETHEELIGLVDDHESILSKILQRDPIARRFPGFPGTVKSLGAWGGDFAMFVSGREQAEVVDILHRQGFSRVFSFSEIEATS